MMTDLDPAKPVKRRDGGLFGATKAPDGTWFGWCMEPGDTEPGEVRWTEDGRAHVGNHQADHCFDLVQETGAGEPRNLSDEWWMNVYAPRPGLFEYNRGRCICYRKRPEADAKQGYGGRDALLHWVRLDGDRWSVEMIGPQQDQVVPDTGQVEEGL